MPVGAFLAFHFYSNFSAMRGAEAFNETARRLQQFPLAYLFEIALIAAPTFFHGIYGLFLSATQPPGAPDPAPIHRVLSILQRVTGVILFAFILFHLWTTRLIQIQDHQSLDLFHLMQAALASPWIHAFYVVGILAATLHLSSGLWSFSITWGLSRGGRAERAVAVAAAALFLILSAMGLRSLTAFRL